MSVHLVLTQTHNGNEISIPIATESFFIKAWRPFAIQNSLSFIQDMQSGYDINQTTLKILVTELIFFENNVNIIYYLTEKERSFLFERIHYILDKIQNETSNQDVCGWVG